MKRMTTYYDQNKKLFHTIFHLAWPSIIEQALFTIVQYIDTAMVGRIGAHASAAVGLTSSVTWLVNAPLFAIGVGILACIAESIGAGNRERAKEYGIQALYFIGILGVLSTAITLSISPFLPIWMGAEPEIHQEASLYFSIVCAPLLFRAASVILGAIMRGAGDTKSPMLANLCMNLVNMVLNFFLIYESRYITLGSFRFYLPSAGLGVAGAAIATAISYCIGGIFMAIVYYRNPALSPRGCSLRHKPELIRKCLRISIPVTLERISAALGQVVFVTLVTRLGTLALATHSIAMTAEQAFYIPGFGMQTAASTMAGQSLGERSQKKFLQTAKITTGMAVLLMTITGGLLFLFPGFMMSLFTKDAQVIAGGITVLKIVAVSEPLFAVAIILEGIFNGIGDTKAPFFFSLISMWGVRILGACFSIFYLHAGLKMIWVFMVADNVTRALLLSARILKGSWRQRFTD